MTGKMLVPYITGGVTGDWTAYVHAAVAAGADMVEIGLPFSDPMLDGPAIQRASDAALSRGATVDGILAEVAALDVPVPLVAMTYANLVFRRGADRFCDSLLKAGIGGLIVPDMPLDEGGPLQEAAERAGIDLVLMVSPATPPDRRRAIARLSQGFVYVVSVMGTTGGRAALPREAEDLVKAVKEEAELPVLLGFGVSSPRGAAAAVTYADGVIVGSAVMQRVLDGASPAQIEGFLGELREAVDRE
jgi:tryptophan synthase alpha chain